MRLPLAPRLSSPAPSSLDTRQLALRLVRLGGGRWEVGRARETGCAPHAVTPTTPSAPPATCASAVRPNQQPSRPHRLEQQERQVAAGVVLMWRCLAPHLRQLAAGRACRAATLITRSGRSATSAAAERRGRGRRRRAPRQWTRRQGRRGVQLLRLLVLLLRGMQLLGRISVDGRELEGNAGQVTARGKTRGSRHLVAFWIDVCSFATICHVAMRHIACGYRVAPRSLKVRPLCMDHRDTVHVTRVAH